MDQLSITVVLELLEKNDPGPVSPTKEQLFLAFLVCKNLADLCDTGRAILNNISSRGKSMVGLPNPTMITLCESILKLFYDEKMFVPDNQLGSRPDWKSVQEFEIKRSKGAFKLYRCLRRNIKEKPDGLIISQAIRKRDLKYFSENFYKIFSQLPDTLTQNLTGFKNMIVSPHVEEKSRNYVWDFFESLLDLVLNEEENIKMLSTL